MKLTGQRCQCPTCGQGFNRVSTFDRHRVGEIGNRRCLSPEEMEAKGWRKNEKDFWLTEARQFGRVVEHFPGGDIGVGGYEDTVQFVAESLGREGVSP